MMVLDGLPLTKQGYFRLLETAKTRRESNRRARRPETRPAQTRTRETQTRTRTRTRRAVAERDDIDRVHHRRE